MSFANPTRLRIGMHGTFAGRDFRLLGRVVMGESEDGETYYWHEFNLQADDGTYADLVFDESEGVGQWKLFTMFEPEYSMTAADAMTKRVGDQLNLTETEVRVTFRGSSRVYRIEGKAPEGVEIGDAAKYFNAEAPDVMQVVSWTGDEVEFYNGVNLKSRDVETAFNLPHTVPIPAKFSSSFNRGSSFDSENYVSIGKFIFWMVIVLVFFFMTFGRDITFPSNYEAAPPKRISAASPPLMTGATGKWDGKNFRITAHAVMEVGEVSTVFERHEYELLDDNNSVSLLICGEQPGATNWMFFSPLAPYPVPTPQQSAEQRPGDLANVDGVVAPVSELFQATIRSMDNVAPTIWRNGTVNFGYAARTRNYSLLARWNQIGVWFYRGQAVSPKEIIAAFPQ